MKSTKPKTKTRTKSLKSKARSVLDVYVTNMAERIIIEELMRYIQIIWDNAPDKTEPVFRQLSMRMPYSGKIVAVAKIAVGPKKKVEAQFAFWKRKEATK